MQLTKKVSFSKTHSFSKFFEDYIQQKESLNAFYNRFPAIENFREQIREKKQSFPEHNREVLTSLLLKQYHHVSDSEKTISNIALLKNENTFTVTTGHQLNIFTGPLYFIYKIVTVINTCKKLKERFSDYNFVPVYWMASEDHDYDEIKSFRLYGKKYTWVTEQQGAVGRFSTKGLDDLIRELPGDVSIFKKAYTENKNLSEAVRQYVHALFGSEGLVVVDADARELKHLFRTVMEDDILNQQTKKIVDETSSQLETLGYKNQVYCRDINFFYLDDQLRSRLEGSGNEFSVIDTSVTFTREQLINAIEVSPEKFSPNVILRPLYQEMILPNLAYIGGPSEVVYWLQLKSVFDHFKIPLPMLMPRNFALIVEKHIHTKFQKTNLEWEDLFKEKNYLFNHWILKKSQNHLSVESDRAYIQKLFTNLSNQVTAIDSTLKQFVGAQEKRTLKGLEKIEEKMLRAEKRKQREKLNQIEAVKDELFPGGNLQERTDNFLNFFQRDTDFINHLINLFDPFDFQFNILSYGHS